MKKFMFVVALVAGLGAFSSQAPALPTKPVVSRPSAAKEAPTIVVLQPVVVTQPVVLRAEHGAVVFHITQARLGLHNYPVRMGVDHGVLALGPGVYRGSSEPGTGHVITAGHNVTPVGPWNHGPYGFLDRLQPGDVARIKFEGETFTYKLIHVRQVVPTNTAVLAADFDLTMTSCWPDGSAQFRLVAQWKAV